MNDDFKNDASRYIDRPLLERMRPSYSKVNSGYAECLPPPRTPSLMDDRKFLCQLASTIAAGVVTKPIKSDAKNDAIASVSVAIAHAIISEVEELDPIGDGNEQEKIPITKEDLWNCAVKLATTVDMTQWNLTFERFCAHLGFKK